MKLKSLLKKCDNQTLDVYLYIKKGKKTTYLNKYSFIDLIENLKYLDSKVESFGYVTDLAHAEAHLQVTLKE